MDRLCRIGTLAQCRACGSDEQTNVINAVNEDGKTRLPWIEIHSENSEEQEKAAQKAEEAEKQSCIAGVSDGAGSGESKKSGAGVGRNDPCPCGSQKKYKKCCG